MHELILNTASIVHMVVKLRDVSSQQPVRLIDATHPRFGQSVAA
jgi:hypothetical protein